MKRLSKKTPRGLVLISLCVTWASAIAELTIPCLDPQVIGVCIWLVCSLMECHTEVTAKIGHFNPDLDVMIINPEGVNRVEDRTRTDSRNRNHNNLIFRDAVALGDIFAGRFYCPSQAVPMVPYFLSLLDQPEWRWGIFDMLNPASWVPGLREIGRWPFNTWGSLYPRTGWTIQSSTPKAAAVTAQRVGDIVTRIGEPHIYLPLIGEVDNGEKVVWEPDGLLENTKQQGYWQVLAPIAEPSCVVFGSNDLFGWADWGGGRVTADGQYYYTLWRPYKCCEIKSPFFLSSVDLIPYPN